jgi:hypothetical protein
MRLRQFHERGIGDDPRRVADLADRFKHAVILAAGRPRRMAQIESGAHSNGYPLLKPPIASEEHGPPSSRPARRRRSARPLWNGRDREAFKSLPVRSFISHTTITSYRRRKNAECGLEIPAVAEYGVRSWSTDYGLTRIIGVSHPRPSVSPAVKFCGMRKPKRGGGQPKLRNSEKGLKIKSWRRLRPRSRHE